jgi:dTDP-4-dehydrorhamnose reductase
MKSSISVLVLGVTGMLGNAVFRLLASSPGFEVSGSARDTKNMSHFSKAIRAKVFTGVDVENLDQLALLLNQVRPNVIINCIGLVKQLATSDDPLEALPLNAIFPHRLARLASLLDARLVHVSTDCVFSGSRGMYVETDIPDARDLYGLSKLLGEVVYPNTVTLRTSIIGHELESARSLICWFLAQEESVKGFRRAIFSGLPTVEIARIIRDYIIPLPSLHGLYHVSAAPISKYDLLHLVAHEYKKNIDIIPDDEFSIDRSLNSDRFRLATGYNPPDWPELIKLMRNSL